MGEKAAISIVFPRGFFNFRTDPPPNLRPLGGRRFFLLRGNFSTGSNRICINISPLSDSCGRTGASSAISIFPACTFPTPRRNSIYLQFRGLSLSFCDATSFSYYTCCVPFYLFHYFVYVSIAQILHFHP